MSQAPITCRIEDGIARLLLDDGKANAISAAFIQALDVALDQAETAKAALLIEGRAGVFSGGLDLKSLPFLDAHSLRQVLADFGRVMLRLYSFPRPVVVRANGHAIAGGAVLMLTADERYGTRGPYKVGLNETALGIPLPRFILEMLKSQLPPWTYHPIVVAGTLMPPEEALRMHLFNEIGEEKAMDERALERVKTLAALPEASYRQNKLAMRAAHLEVGRAAYAAELDGFANYFANVKR